MYAPHFGLNQDPFSIAPDPRYLFMSERHREALAHLLYGVSGSSANAGGTGGGFVLLTGDIGTGKTTICRCFLEQIPDGCHVAYIFNPKLTVGELLQTVCEEFHIAVKANGASAPTVKDYIDTLNVFLLHSHAQGQTCVLIIDEAQNLHPEVLEQLRLLTNLETNERKLLQIVLIGQPELRTMLQQPQLAQLAQRVIARFHLDALSAPETTQYISHRLAVAGHHGALPFDNAAVRSIHRLSQGVPRRINLLCGRALLGAWVNGAAHVNADIVQRAAREVFGDEVTVVPVQREMLTRYRWIGLGGLASVTVAVAGAVWFASSGHAQRSQPPLVASPKSLAPSPVATPVATPVANTVDSLDVLLPQLPREPNTVWNALAQHWKLPATSASPCDDNALGAWECFQTNLLTVPQLAQLARPGMVKLRVDEKTVAYALLEGLTDQTASFRIGTELHTVRLTSLVRIWDGNYATLWQAPTGYKPLAHGGSTPPFFEILAKQLARIEGTPAPIASPQSLDETLSAQVRNFQRSHGLKADGQPGPLTLMQVERALATLTPQR